MPHKITYACFNGTILPENDLHISFAALAGDLGWTRSWRVFDVMEARGTVLFHGEDHYKRLLNSAREALLPIQGVDYIERLPELVKKLLKKNGFAESVVRVDITGGSATPHSYAASRGSNLFIQVSPAHPKDDVRELSLKAIRYKREFPHIKTANYYAACVAMQAAQHEGHHDVLFIDADRDNRVLETSRKNIFFVNKKNEILTPHEDILPGITQKIILGLARSNGYTVREREITLNDLARYKEVFATSTTYYVAPVIRIGGLVDLTFPVGEVSMRLHKLFKDYCEKYYKEHGGLSGKKR